MKKKLIDPLSVQVEKCRKSITLCHEVEIVLLDVDGEKDIVHGHCITFDSYKPAFCAQFSTKFGEN